MCGGIDFLQNDFISVRQDPSDICGEGLLVDLRRRRRQKVFSKQFLQKSIPAQIHQLILYTITNKG